MKADRTGFDYCLGHAHDLKDAARAVQPRTQCGRAQERFDAHLFAINAASTASSCTVASKRRCGRRRTLVTFL